MQTLTTATESVTRGRRLKKATAIRHRIKSYYHTLTFVC